MTTWPGDIRPLWQRALDLRRRCPGWPMAVLRSHGRGIKPGARGFAALDSDTVRYLARQGGRASQKSGNGHRFSSVEAREAGRVGGLVSQARRRKK